MKTLKRTEQRNVLVNRDMHSMKEITELIENGHITVADRYYRQLQLTDLDFMYESSNALNDYSLIIFLEHTKEIKVVYNKDYGFYDNIVVMEDGTKISIKL